MTEDALYQFLGLLPGSGVEEIRRSRNELISIWAPQKFRSRERLELLVRKHHDFINAAAEQLLKVHTKDPSAGESNNQLLEEFTVAEVVNDSRFLFEFDCAGLAKDLLQRLLASIGQSLDTDSIARLHSEIAYISAVSHFCDDDDGLCLVHSKEAVRLAEHPTNRTDRATLGYAWRSAGLSCLKKGQLSAADSLLSRAQETLQSAGMPPVEVAPVIYQRARLYAEQGKVEEAAELCHHALQKLLSEYDDAPLEAVSQQSIDPSRGVLPYQTTSWICSSLLTYAASSLPENCPEHTVHEAARRALDAGHAIKLIAPELSEPHRTELMLAALNAQAQLVTLCLNRDLQGAHVLAQEALHFARVLFSKNHERYLETQQRADASRVRHLIDSCTPLEEWNITFAEVFSYAAFHWERVMTMLNRDFPSTSLFTAEAFREWSRFASSEEQSEREMAECHFTHLALHYQSDGVILGQCVADFYLSVIATAEGRQDEILDGFERAASGCCNELGETSPVTVMCKTVEAFAHFQVQSQRSHGSVTEI